MGTASPVSNFGSILTFLFLLSFVPCALKGQTSGTTRSRQLQQLATVESWPTKSKRWALVIGVDKYADTQITTLGGSSNDAKTLADALVRYAAFPPDQVTLLASDQPAERQPTRGNILRRLSNLASVVPTDGLLVLSFAGHGMERGNQAFLLPSDAQVSNDVDLLEQTAINVTQMKERIRKTGVGQVVLILDACRNDPVGRSDSDNNLSAAYTRGFNFDVRNREVTAFATLYATAVGHRAYEYKEKQQGYFTWELIEGLKGGAANERGEITLEGLLKYVQERVPKHVLADLGAGKEQKPFAEIGGYRADQLVIAVAPLTAKQNIPIGSPVFPKVDLAAFEISYWETIKQSNDPEDFKSYLQKYPNGQFADLARRRAQQGSAAQATSLPVNTQPKAITEAGAINQQQVRPGIMLADIFTLGFDLGLAEIYAYQNGPSAYVQQYLGYSQTVAGRSGLATWGIDSVVGQLRTGATTASQYQSLVATRQAFEQTLNRNCNCGNAVNFVNVFALGGQLGFLETISYQNGDPNYVIQIMTSSVQYAKASSLPSKRLEEFLLKLRSGKRARDVYKGLVDFRAELMQTTNRLCGC